MSIERSFARTLDRDASENFILRELTGPWSFELGVQDFYGISIHGLEVFP